MYNFKKVWEKACSFRKEISPAHFWTKKNDTNNEYEIRSNNEIKLLLEELVLLLTDTKTKKIS